MASSDRIDELKRKFDENPRRYFAPLANEFRKGGDLDQAILICQEFLPQQPGHMSGHIVYGQALFESGRLDDARGVFETALSLDPENLIALRHLGDIASRQGDPTTARRWYERVLEADPRNDEIQSLLGSLGSAPVGEEVARAPSVVTPEIIESVTVTSEPSEPPHPSVPERSDEPELLDLDVTLPETAWAVPAMHSPSGERVSEPSDPEPAVIGDIEPMPETADLMPSTEGRAEGFESTEFSAPETPVEQTEGLESAFEVETGVHVSYGAPLPGLDRPDVTPDEAPAVASTSGFPELDEPMPEDRGDVLPPHGDPIVHGSAAPTITNHDAALSEFDLEATDEPPREAAPAADGALASTTSPVAASDASAPPIPTELPPEVIAAEAELIDAGETPAPEDAADEEAIDTESVGSELSFLDVDEASPSPPEESAPATTPSEPPASAAPAEAWPAEPLPEHKPFVTETMAELYLKQGFRQEALSVYEQLLGSNPGDEKLSTRIAALRAELAAPPTAPGLPARDFFARIASRRPGERAAAAAPPSDDDFGPSSSDSVPAPASAPAEPPTIAGGSPASAPVDEAPQRSGGSIDALFGHRPIDSTEDSAASALAQAFGSESETSPLAGNPTRPASGELSLDSVFREGGARGPRSSQGFSFDQFFSQNVEGDRTAGGSRDSQEDSAPGEPADRSEDDIEQFNSWLQGLKQR